MDFFETVHGTKRLNLYTNELPSAKEDKHLLIDALSAFSIWGGRDEISDEKWSWEFGSEMSKEIICIAIERLGCMIKEEDKTL